MTNSTILNKLITSCLCLSLLGLPATAASAKPNLEATVAQSTTPAPVSNINQQLLGQWQTTDGTGQPITFVFAPEGKLFLMKQVPNGPALAQEMRYKIDVSSQPMALDVSLSQNETVLTVFELTADGQMRLQLAGTNPGLPRPSSLTAEANVFKKVSETTSLPANTQLKEF